MKSDNLNNYSLANIIANEINYEIEKERNIKNYQSFSGILKIINECEYYDTMKIIIYVFEQLNLFNKNDKKHIINNIVNDINFKYSTLI